MNRRAAATAFLERFRVLAPRRWHGLVAFNYHRIGDPGGSPLDRALWSATVEEFAAQVAFLRREFDVVRLEDVPALQRGGRGRHALITFDDGYRDNHDLALPVLRAHGVCAAFFVTTGFLDGGRQAWWDEIAWMARNGRRGVLPASPWLAERIDVGQDVEAAVRRLASVYKRLPSARTGAYLEWLGEATGSGRCPPGSFPSPWMTWEMVRALRAAGMAIGGHTVSHPVLSRTDRAGQEQEILGCARRVQEELGEPMRWFAYPVGGPDAFDADTRAVLEAAGVELAFSYYGGYRRYDAWDRLDVRRIPVEPYVRGDSFRATARWPMLMAPHPGQRWPARLRETLRGVVGF
jgi:peptidoglycan/xylan/chitin deacetylase (PgdA/CDA1 family)